MCQPNPKCPLSFFAQAFSHSNPHPRTQASRSHLSGVHTAYDSIPTHGPYRPRHHARCACLVRLEKDGFPPTQKRKLKTNDPQRAQVFSWACTRCCFIIIIIFKRGKMAQITCGWWRGRRRGWPRRRRPAPRSPSRPPRGGCGRGCPRPTA